MRLHLSYLSLVLCSLVSTAFAQEVSSGQLFATSYLEFKAPTTVGWQLFGTDPNTFAFARNGRGSNDSFVAFVSMFALPPTKDPDDFVSRIRSAVEQDSPPDRFTTIEAKFKYNEDRGYPCVRFQGISEDKQARTGLFTRTTLKIQVRALYCRHPKQPALGFVAFYSYRGKTLYPDLDAEADSFLQGVAVPVPTATNARIDEGVAAYVRNDFVTAIKEFTRLANQGDARAQYNLGKMYDDGKGVTQNSKEAARWYRLSADQGHPSAQFALGIMYGDGEGVSQDFNEAVKWYRLASAHGHAGAQVNLGRTYEEGRGVTQDNQEAMTWFRLAAFQGSSTALYNVGVMYASGQGVRQDNKEAMKWFRLAADQGSAAAIGDLGAIYAEMKSDVKAYALFDIAARMIDAPTDSQRAARNREKLSSFMSAEQISEGQSLSREMGQPGMLLKVLDR